MDRSLLHPYRFERIPVAKPWAGDNLSRFFGPSIPAGSGETIEIADNADFSPVVAEGKAKRKSLADLAREIGAQALFGQHKSLPLMLKLIATSAPLSVQVHPKDEIKGNRLIRRGKSEAWYILDAKPGAILWQGVKSGVTKDVFFDAAARGRIDEVMLKRDVQAGDCIFSPAGMVHAIGAGLTLIELQQNSNVTYRIYDWGRSGRDLDIEAARAATDLSLVPSPAKRAGSPESQDLATCPQFHWVSHTAEQSIAFESGTFRLLTLVSGKARLEWQGGSMELGALSSVLIPHACGSMSLIPLEGSAHILEARA